MENYYNSLNSGVGTWFKKTSTNWLDPSGSEKAVDSTFRNSYARILFVLLLVVSSFTGQKLSAQTYLSESFEGAWYLNGNSSAPANASGPNAPSGWRQTRVLNDVVPVGSSTLGAADWSQANYSGGAYLGTTVPYVGTAVYGTSYSPPAPVNGNNILWFRDGSCPTGNTRRMESPALDLSASTSPLVSFSYSYQGTATVSFMASNDGGTTWATIGTISNNSGWATKTYNLPASYKVANAKFGIQIAASYGSYDVYVDNFVVREAIVPNAPPTSLVISSVGKTGMTIGWTDASTNETAFRVYRSTDNVTFTQVGSDITSTTTAGTGTAYTLAQTGLVPGTTYYYRVVAASEGETTFLTGSQSTVAGATYYWVGPSGAAWQNPTSWNTAANGSGSPRTQSLPEDILIMDGAGTTPGAATTAVLQASQTIGILQITNNTPVSIEGYNSTGATLTISGGGGEDFTISSGSSLTLNHASFPVSIVFSGSGHTGTIAGTLNMGGSGSNSFSTTGGTGTLVTVTGTVNNGGTISTSSHITGSAATLVFAASGIYNHTYALGGTVPTATWNIASNVNVTGITSAASSVSGFSGQTFGNVTWNPSAQGSAVIALGISSSTTVIAGNFTIANTGSGSLTLTSSGTLTVGGNYLQSAGYVYLASSSGTLAVTGNATIASGATLDLTAGSSSATFKAAGSFTNNGILTETGTSTASTLEFNGTSAQAVTVGTANNNISYRVNNNSGINLTGAMTIVNGSGLTISSTAATPISGGTLSYAASGTTLTYNSTTGSQTPTANEWKSSGGPNNIVFNNTTAAPNNRIFLGSIGNRTVTGGTLTLTSGVTILDSSNLTIAASGSLSGSVSSTNFIATNGSGKLLQAYAGSVTSRTFPLGDITGTEEASSVVLAFTSLTGASTVGISVTDAQHPNDASTSNFLSRYYTFTETGASDYTYNLTLNYPSGEITGLSALTRLNRWNGTSWSTTNATTVGGSSSIAVTGITYASDPLNNSSFTLRPYQGTYTWKGGTSGSFAAAANWSPSRTTPDASDVLVFNGSNIDGAGGTGAITATSVASQTIGKFQFTNNANVSLYSNVSSTITIAGSEGVDFEIQAGSTLSLTGPQALTISHTSNSAPNANTATIAGTLNLNSTSGSTYSASSSVTTVTGTINNTTGTVTGSSTSLIFAAGSNYNHLYPTGGTVPTATWNIASNVNFPGPNSGATSISGISGATFGNFNWNPTAQGTASINLGISSVTTIAGNLTITNTGSSPSATQSNFGFASTTSSAYLVVGGNFNLNAGYLVGITGSTGSSAIVVVGNSVIGATAKYDLSPSAGGSSFQPGGSLVNNGTILVSGASTGCSVLFVGTTPQAITIGTITGQVNFGTYNNAGVTLTGTLPINLNASLQVSCTATVPFTGSIAYGSGTSLYYYSTSTAAVGNMTITDNELPVANGPTTLIVANSTATNNRVFLNTTGDRTIGTLTNSAGVLVLGNNNLTVGTFSGTASATNFVATNGTGQLKKVYSTSGSATFPLGDITGTDEVSTVMLSYTTLPTASTVGVRVTDAQTPNDASSNNYLTRYFSFTESGASASSVYNLTLNYTSGDVVGTIASTKLNRWNGSVWNEVASTTPTTTSVAVTGVAFSANGLNNTEFTLRPSSRSYVWTGATDSAWTTASNWSPARTTPDASDELTFNGATVASPTVTAVPTQTIARLLLTNNANVTLQSPTNNTLTIAGAAGTDLDIPAGSTLNLNNTGFSTAITFTGTGNTGTIAGTLNLGGLVTNTLTTTSGTSTVVTVTGTTNVGAASPSASMLVGSAATLIYSGTAIYNHYFATGGTVPTATWGATTNINFPGPNDGGTAIAGISGNTFTNNFNWNPTAQGSAAINLGLSSSTTFGNVNINATGTTGSLRFTSTGSSTYTVSGTYTQGNNTTVGLTAGTGAPTLAIAGAATIGTGATFDLSSGSATPGSGKLNLAGDFTNNGTLTETGTSTASTVTFNGTGAQAVAIGTNTNTLLYGVSNASALNLTGTLNITTGAGFTHASSANVGGSGSIVYSGVTFLTYSGSTAKTQGLEWPASLGTTPTVTINLTGTSPANRLTMTSSRTLSAGSLVLTNGVTLLGNNNLTLGDTATATATASNTNFVGINGTGQFLKSYAATGPFTFPIGEIDGTEESSYFTLNYTALAGTSTVGVRVIDAQHPADTSTDNYLSRYFKVTESGATSYTYTVTLNYPSADFVGTGSFARLYRYNGTSFVAPTAQAIAGTTTTSTTGAIAGYTNTADPLNGSDFTVRPYTNAYTWTGATDTAWTTATNWTPNRTTPTTTDVLTFNTVSTVTAIPSETIGRIVLTGSANIQLQAAAAATLTIGGGAGTDLDVPTGTSLSLNGANAWTLAYGSGTTANIAGTFTHGGGAAIITHNLSGTQFTVNGTYNNTGSVVNAFPNNSSTNFLVNGNFNLNVSAAVAAIVPTGTYSNTSTVTIVASGAAAATPAVGQTFNGNFVINSTGSGAVVSTGSPTINGNLTVTSTGTGSYSFGTGSVTVNGLTTVTAGTLTSAGNTFNLNGGLTQNGGTITVGSSGTNTINVGNASTPGVFTQTAGSITHSAATANGITLNLYGDATIAGTISETAAATGSVAINFRKAVSGNQNINTTGMTQSGSFSYISSNTPGLNLTGTLLVNGTTPSSTFTNSGLGVISGGTFIYSTGNTLTYSSSGGSQTAGSEWPATNSPTVVTINNTTSSPNNRVLFSSLTGDRTTATFAQSSGVLVLGSNSLTTSSFTGSSSASSSNFVATNGSGQLKYAYPTGPSSATFPLGDITNTDEASAVTLAYTSANPTVSTVGIRVTDAKNPNDASATDYLARYFSFTETGATPTSTATLTLNYPTANVVGSYPNTRLNRWNGFTWSQVGNATPTTSSVVVAGIDYTALNGNDFTLRPAAIQTYTWAGGASAAYNAPASWSPSRTTPDPSDVLVFNGANINGAGATGNIAASAVPIESVGRILLQNNATVSLSTSVANCALTINGGVGTDLDIPSGSTLTLFGQSGNVFTLGYGTGSNATAVIAGNFNLGDVTNTTAGHTYTFNNAVTTVTPTGTFTNYSAAGGGATSATASTFIVNGTYVHNPTATNGGTIPTATFAATSTLNIKAGATTVTYPSANSIGNLILNNIGSGAIAPTLGLSSSVTVQGNLTVNSTGTSTGGFAFGTTPTVTVNGTTTITAGKLDLSSSLTGGGTFNALGNVVMNGGSIGAVSTSGTNTLNIGNLGTPTTFTMNSGSSITSASVAATGGIVVNLFGDFTMNTGSTLTETSTGGAVAVNFVKTIGSAQNIAINGTVANSMLFKHASTSGVNLSGTLTLDGTQTPPSGFTLVGPGSFTGSGAISYSGTGSLLTYNGAANQTAGIEWPATNSPANVTINNTGATATTNLVAVPFNRTIAGTLTMTSGNIDLTSNTLTLGTAEATPGTLAYTAGTIRVTTGALTRWFPISGLPTVATGTGIGFFPLASGLNNRAVNVYFSGGTINNGGSVTVSHADANALTDVTITDGAYNVNKRTNASWTFTQSGFNLGAVTLGVQLKTAGNSAFAEVVPTNTNLRLVQAAAPASGTHVNSSSTASPTTFNIGRAGLAPADLNATYYIGGSAADFPSTFTAIATGDWADNTTWDKGYQPGPTDTVLIPSPYTVTASTAAVGGIVTINSGAGVTVQPSATLTLTGAVTNNGTLTNNGGFSTTSTLTNGTSSTVTNNGTFAVASTFANNGTYVNTNGTANFTTSAAATAATGISNNGGATFRISNGTVNLGISDNTVNNRTFANTGGNSTLEVLGGTLNVYGNLANGTTSYFNQSGGAINIDGNAGGNATNSVASGTPLLSFTQVNARINLTGGTLTIVDPHTATTNTSAYAIYYSNGTVGSQTTTAAHTIRFGNGTSADAGGNASGFYTNNWVSSAMLSFGSIEVNGPSANNRSFNPGETTAFAGNITVNNNGSLNTTVLLIVGGNIQVNTGGTFTSTAVVNLSAVASNTSTTIATAPVTVAQTIGGAGTIQNAASSATGNFGSLTINNNNATGVTLTSPLSVTGTLIMSSGIINTTATNLLSLGTTTANGTLTATPSATNYISGPFARTFAASRTASGTYDSTTLFPVGRGGGSYSLYIDPTTTATGPVVLRGEAFNTNAGTFSAPITSLSPRRFEALPITGAANLTNVFVKILDATPGSIATNSKIVQATTAAGAYGAIAPATNVVAATSVATATSIPVASYTGYLSYGSVTVCVAPTDQPTSLVVASKNINSVTANFTAATSSPSGYLVVRYLAGATVTPPADFTLYTPGSLLGAGTVVSSNSTTTFTASSLATNTAYDFYVYSYTNSGSCSGPAYLTANPLTQTVTTCESSTAPATALTLTTSSSTGATVSWTASVTAGVNYFVDVATNTGFTTFVPGFTNLNVGTNLSVNITGLSATTTYYVRVRADLTGCLSANSSTFTILTPCAATPFPWTENFDSMATIGSGVVPSCWAQQAGSSTWYSSNAAYTSYNDPKSGTNYMTIYYGATPDYLWTPNFALTAGVSYDFSFYFVGDATAGWNGDVLANNVASATGATSLGAFLAPATTTLRDTNYTKVTRSFTPTVSGNYFFGVKVFTSTSAPFYLGFDDFGLDFTPTCVAPTALTASITSFTTATIGWTASTTVPTGGYDYYVSTNSTAPTATTTPTGNVDSSTLTKDLTGLNPNTTYYFWVRSHCTGVDQSTWAASSFYTGYCIPSGSTTYYISNFATTGGYANITNPTSASAGGYGNYATSTVSQSPGGSFNVSITETGGTSLYYVWVDWNNDLDFNDAGESMLATTSYAASYTGALTIPAAQALGSYRMRIANSDSGVISSACGPNTYGEMEDYTINVIATPTCFSPTSLAVSAITNNSATLTWNTPTTGTPTSYQYEIRTSGNPGSGATGLKASGTGITVLTANATGLNGGVTYNAYVRSFCGGTDYSEWTGITFTTLCDPVTTFPFTENFESVTAPALPACWTKIDANGDGDAWITYNDVTYAQSGTKSVGIYTDFNAGNNNDYLILPPMTLTGGQRLKYSIRSRTTGEPNDYTVKLSTTGIAPANFTTVLKPLTVVTSATYTQETIDLSAYSGTVNIAFHIPSGGLDGYYLNIDDVIVENIPPAITSFAPTSICSGTSSSSFTNNGSTVTITGTNIGNATSVLFTSATSTVAATIQSNTGTQIVAVIPTGAITGPIAVYTAAGNVTSTGNFVVNPNPAVGDITVSTDPSYSPNPACMRTAAEVTALGGPAIIDLDDILAGGVWSITSGASNVSLDQNGRVTGLNEGSATIRYTVTTSGCSAYKEITVTFYKPVEISSFTPQQTTVPYEAANPTTTGIATFTVAATGTGLHYQWWANDGIDDYKLGDGSNGTVSSVISEQYTGYNSNTLNITQIDGNNAGFEYYCVVTGTSPCGSKTTSPNSSLVVSTTGIASDPVNVTLCPNVTGASANFTVVKSGNDTVTYSWEYRKTLPSVTTWTTVPNGAIDATGITASNELSDQLSLGGIVPANNGYQFRANITGPNNVATSNPATLTVNTPVSGVSIVSSPANATNCYSGGSTTYTVAATAGTFTTVQWQYSTTGTGSWNNVVNATPAGTTYTASANSLTVATTSATPASGTYYYRAVLTGASQCGTTNSNAVQLFINNPVVSAPAPQTVLGGNSAQFSVTTTAPSPGFVWQYSANGTTNWNTVVNQTPATVTYAVVNNAGTSTLTVNTTEATPASTGYYRAVVTTGGCSVNSANGVLTINNYCTTGLTTGTGTTRGITKVVLTNTSEITSVDSGTTSIESPYYTYYNGLGSLTISRGQDASASITFGSSGSSYSAVWVDYNKNGTFEASENVGLATSSATSTRTFAFTIPLTAELGTTRIRVRAGYNSAYAATDACTALASGETEDYLLNITPVQPPTITSLGSTDGCVGNNITINGSNLVGLTAANVTIGGTPVTSIVSNTPTQIVAVIPQTTSGAVAVTAAGGSVTGPNFTVYSLPNAVTVTGGGVVCTSSTVINASIVGGGVIYYQGTNANGTSTTTPSTSQTVTASGTYYFRAVAGSGCWGPAGSVVVNFVTAPVAPTTTNYNVCVNGTIPTGQGLTSTFAGALMTGTQTINFNVTDQPLESNSSSVTNVVASATMAALPAGAVITNATITYTGITPQGGSYASDVYLGLSGALVNTAASGTGAVGSGSQLISFNYTRTTTAVTGSVAGGTVNLIYWDSTNDVVGGDDAIFSRGNVASVVINYTYPDPNVVQWYTAQTGGLLVGTGTPFNPIGKPNALPNTATAGTYTYYAQVNNGCTSVRTGSDLIVGAPLAATATPSITTPVCGGAAVTLSSTATGGGGTYTYSWKVGATEVSTLSSFVVNPTATTTYNLTVTDACAATTTASVTITVNPLPTVVTVSTAGTYCSSTTITASNGGSGTIYFQGTTSGGTSTATASSSQVITTSGTYYFRAQSAAGCWGPEGSVAIVINTPPAAFSVTNAAICEGATSVAMSSTISCPATTSLGNTISGSWTSASPTSARQTTLANSTTCSFSSSDIRPYEAVSFTVSTTGTYVFEMADNTTYDGMGYITTGAFTPGSCSTGTFVIGDDDSSPIADEPMMTVALTAGVTYTLYSQPFAALSSLPQSYTWNITSTAGGTAQWYTAASGGTSIGSGTSFNPVGVAGSGLANTNTPGVTTYYVACSSNPACRTAVTYTINAKPTLTVSGAITPVCGATTANLTSVVTSNGTVTYFSNSGYTTAVTTPAAVTVAGTYYVRATSASGCTTDSTIIVNPFRATPAAPTGSLAITNSTCASACTVSGGSIAIGTVAGSGGTIEYSTNNGTTWSSTLPTYNAPQTILASVISPEGCRSASATVGSTVAGTCTTPATPTVTASGSTTFCAGGSVVLTSSAGNAYLWSNGATTASITATNSGSYTVQVRNASGCLSLASAATVVTVTAQPVWYLDADGDHYYTGTGITSCTSPGAGYTTSVIAGGDCNDSVASINPGVAEICYNNIDDNCNNTMSEGCAPVVVNMTPSYNNTALTSLAQAIPAIAYTYAPYTNLKYRFSITNTTTGVTAADIIQTSRYVTIPAALHSYPGTYTIKASAVINEEILPYAGNTITVFAPTVQVITLSSASCGSTLAALSSTLSADAGPNATGYTFRIRLNDTNPTPTYATSQSATRFIGANTFTGFPLQYSSSYKVSVRYTYTDPVSGLPVESPYGAECTINTPSIPLTTMASPTCGSTVTAMNANISAAAASYATSYQFRIRLFSDNSATPTYYYSVPNASRFSSLTAFQGITFAYSTAYSISVQYSVLNGNTTVWSGYGAECKVTTPFFPTTSLVPSQCGLATATSLTQQLNITPYPGFPNYKVKLDEVSGEDIVNSQEIVVSYSYFRLNQFSIAQLGKNYNVSVAIKLNGVFGDYSTACDLFTPAPAKTNTLVAFKATAYPNPFANNFMIDVKTSSHSIVNLKVYDMIGRMIEQRDVRVSDLESAAFGNNYPSGVYNIVVSQDDSVETVRAVKR